MASWQAEVEDKVCFVPTGQVTAGGKEKLRRVRTTSIFLTRERPGGLLDFLKFTVTRRKGVTRIGDHRLAQTGERAAGYSANAGPCKGERYAGAGGRAEQLTPAAWVREVERLIGRERAIEVVRELGAWEAYAIK